MLAQSSKSLEEGKYRPIKEAFKDLREKATGLNKP
jgi:hypothetical protein